MSEDSDALEELIGEGHEEDEEVEEDEGEVLKVRADRLHKFNQYKPKANIYKCWAIDLLRGRGKLMTFLVFVILLQSLSPLFLFGYARRQMRTHDVVNAWADLWKGYVDSGGNATNFQTNETINLSFPAWAWYDSDATVLISQKLLGIFLMVIICLQNDEALLGYDLESHNFKKYFPMVPHWKRWFDTSINAWTMSMIGIVVGPMFALQDTLVDLLLNSVGLIFIANVDYIAASGLSFGFDEQEFDELVDIFRDRYLKELLESGFQDDDSLPVASILVSFFRLFNLVNMTFQIIAYGMFDLEEDKVLDTEAHAEVPTILQPGLRKLLPFWYLWLPPAICVLGLVFIIRSAHFAQGCFKARNASPEKAQMLRSAYEVQEFDVKGFFLFVVLRRVDPRYQVRFFRLIAMKQADYLAKITGDLASTS